ncbi:hypothetical protein [Corynebacterium pyruviciproducens]|uniref:hypothetical protein n=1 Tax=Corynebacterium pyruviciproducens TaxID=598660 RepID=UPI0023F0A7F7|nr:hypothetical protein [Corynebacterium pyruviciproducens]
MENIVYFADEATKPDTATQYATAVHNWALLSNEEDGFGFLFTIFGQLKDIADGISKLLGLV